MKDADTTLQHLPNRTSAFFKHSNVDTKSRVAGKNGKRVVNLGDQDDSVFRALAAALVDFIANHASVHVHDTRSLCSKILQSHLKNFPYYAEKIGQGLWTSIDRLERMRYKQGFIPDLALTLFLLAEEELNANFERYPETFVAYAKMQTERKNGQRDEQSVAALMERMRIWVGTRACEVIVNVLSIPITVRITSPNKELFQSLSMIPDHFAKEFSPKNGIELLLDEDSGHYQAFLSDPSSFAIVANQVASMLGEPSWALIQKDRTNSDLDVKMNRITVSDEQFLVELDANKELLMQRVDKGELTKVDLLAIYIDSMNRQDRASQGHFERAIKKAQSQASFLHSDDDHGYDSMIVGALVNALVRLLSTKVLSLQDIHNQRSRENHVLSSTVHQGI